MFFPRDKKFPHNIPEFNKKKRERRIAKAPIGEFVSLYSLSELLLELVVVGELCGCVLRHLVREVPSIPHNSLVIVSIFLFLSLLLQVGVFGGGSQFTASRHQFYARSTSPLCSCNSLCFSPMHWHVHNSAIVRRLRRLRRPRRRLRLRRRRRSRCCWEAILSPSSSSWPQSEASRPSPPSRRGRPRSTCRCGVQLQDLLKRGRKVSGENNRATPDFPPPLNARAAQAK